MRSLNSQPTAESCHRDAHPARNGGQRLMQVARDHGVGAGTRRQHC